MKAPRVSVIMPVYNGEKFLREAIDSILQQSFADFELLLINDGSSDGSEKIILSYTDPRIKYILNSKNIGLIATLNKGIQLSSGEYLARMDADDISLPHRFEKQVNFLDKNIAVAVLATKVQQINEAGAPHGFWKEDVETTSWEEIKKTMPILNCIAHPSVMMRKTVIEKFGYNTSLKFSEDWGLWLSLLSANYKIAKLDEILIHYRIHSSSTTIQVNAKGVEKKILQFKFSYLKGKLFKFNKSETDKAVTRSLIKNCIQYWCPTFLLRVYSFYHKKPFRILSEWLNNRNYFNSKKLPEIIFFFPFYHTGGAEKVHASIVEACNGKNVLVIMTGRSDSDTYLAQLKKHANVLDVFHVLGLRYTKQQFTNQLLSLVNKNPNMILFGCNSEFYYEFIKFVPETLHCIDLLHAFGHAHENGAEHWSLPLVQKLSNRIIINQKTFHDFELQYQQNGLDARLLNHIKLISNFTPYYSLSEKNFDGKLIALYVGRGTAEKRVHLISKVASILHAKNIPVEFHFLGDLREAIPQEDRDHCVFAGEIKDEVEMHKVYTSAHLLMMASSREGFPMVIMEGMMHGLVTISTAVGGISEHVHSGENGILLHEKEADALVDSIVAEIESLVAHRSLLAKLSQNAHAYAVTHFQKKSFEEKYQQIFQKNS
ncbi:MAG: glycosyltransferase [Bacteroidetes bacterium]|nr:glycosyltransferase [Bacteroidota bacterium]